MPRKYKRKEGAIPRIPVNENSLRLAVQEVLNGKSIRGTAKCFDISIMTLKRYVSKKRAAMQENKNQDIKYAPNYRKAQIFTPLEEDDLKNYLETASKLFYGLSPLNVRQLAYQYIRENGKNGPPKWHDKETATCDWFHGFMNRHKSLSLRVPKATNLSHSSSTLDTQNKGKFFYLLKSLMLRLKFRADQIWNIDEGLITIHNPTKIFACRGLEQVPKVTSGERGEQITVYGAINADGNHLPPFIIFPRKVCQTKVTNGGPPGTESAAYENGWMTGSSFVNFLKFFIKHVRCNKENQCLVILDSHESHVTIESINFAKENGINLLTIPPRTSQILQPLDRILFGTLETYYNSECNDWTTSHPGRLMTIYEIAGCLRKAYPRAMTPSNIKKNFEVSGIYPLNSEIFKDGEFLGSFAIQNENPDKITASVDLHVSRTPSPLTANDPLETHTDIIDVPVVLPSSTVSKKESAGTYNC